MVSLDSLDVTGGVPGVPSLTVLVAMDGDGDGDDEMLLETTRFFACTLDDENSRKTPAE